MALKVSLAGIVLAGSVASSHACLLEIDISAMGIVRDLTARIESRFGGHTIFKESGETSVHRLLLPPPFCSQPIAIGLTVRCESGKTLQWRNPSRGHQVVRRVQVPRLCR